MTQISAETPTPLPTIAPFGVRFGGYLIDGLCVVVVNVTASFALLFAPSPVDSIIALALPVAWYALFWRLAHATPGKLALSLRIEPATGPGPLTWWQILRRYVIAFGIPVALVAPFALRPAGGQEAIELAMWTLVMSVVGLGWTLLDCLWSLSNPAHQALHDKAAGTVVVRVS